MENFEKATWMKLRFETPKGKISCEDLCDLPLTSSRGTSLDDIAKNLNKQLKEVQEESFVVAKSIENTELELAFNIVKHVISVKLEEKQNRENAAKVKAQKEKIASIIASKQDEDLASKDIEELKRMHDELKTV